MAAMGETYKEDEHSKNLVASLNNFRSSNFMCDVILVTKSKEYFAHRNVLCASSPYFLDRLTSSTNEASNTMVPPTNPVTTLGSRLELQNISSEILEDVLGFMYKGEICVGEENVRQIISASDILRMTNLKEIACRFYEKRLCPANCIVIATLAEQFNCETLKLAADSFILEHFLEVSSYRDFKDLTCKHVSRIISSDKICVETEEQIFTAAMEWLHFDIEGRQKYMAEILKCIRLLHTSKYFLSDVVEQDSLLTAHPGCVQIINEAKFMFEFPDRKHLVRFRNEHKPRHFADLTEIVIVAGGNQERMSSNEVLCYVPSQDFWYPLAPITYSRYLSASIVMENSFMVIGGKTEEVPSRYTEKYLFSSDKWVDSTALPIATYNHVACVFNGEIYVIGGESNGKSLANVLKFSVEKGEWIEVKGLRIPRRAACVAVHKQLYAIGGYGPDGQALASVERFNPYINEWSKIFPMTSARAGACAICLENKIYVFGGEYAMWSYYRSAEVFNIDTDEWRAIADMSVPRAFMGITSYNDSILVIGGMVPGISSDQYGMGDDEDEFVDVNETNIVESYDRHTNTWKSICSLPVPTAGMNCACITVSKTALEKRCGFS